jgi:N-acetyl-gamma-glutamyl-phosphate reductase
MRWRPTQKIGVLGASGYTGADAVRPNVEITALTANTHAGKSMNEVFPHFFMLDDRLGWFTLLPF